jgi:hypothetical protein
MCTVKLEGDGSATYFSSSRSFETRPFSSLSSCSRSASHRRSMLYFRVSLAQTRLKLYARCLRSSKPTFNGRLRKNCI